MPESIRDENTSVTLHINNDGSINVNLVGNTPATENKRGSDCSDDNSDIGRVLTLTNTSTSSEEMITLNGTVLVITVDYAISHLSSSSTITFVGQIFDADYIGVRYYE